MGVQPPTEIADAAVRNVVRKVLQKEVRKAVHKVARYVVHAMAHSEAGLSPACQAILTGVEPPTSLMELPAVLQLPGASHLRLQEGRGQLAGRLGLRAILWL
ncbi:hypothetical protein GCM10009800_21590 [Nocardiopsis rhodophaea]